MCCVAWSGARNTTTTEGLLCCCAGPGPVGAAGGWLAASSPTRQLGCAWPKSKKCIREHPAAASAAAAAAASAAAGAAAQAAGAAYLIGAFGGLRPSHRIQRRLCWGKEKLPVVASPPGCRCPQESFRPADVRLSSLCGRPRIPDLICWSFLWACATVDSREPVAGPWRPDSKRKTVARPACTGVWPSCVYWFL